MVTVDSQSQLLLRMDTEAMIMSNMIPIENGLDFLEVPETMDLSREVHILVAVFMILGRTTIECVTSDQLCVASYYLQVLPGLLILTYKAVFSLCYSAVNYFLQE